MTPIDELKQSFDKNRDDIMKEYFTLLRFKTISADPTYKNDLEACASWLQTYLEKIGLKVEKWTHPTGTSTIFAATDYNPDNETLLLYCHYDVQPVDPIDLWDSPPFEPTVRQGKIYARGACDNKGQLFYTIFAVKTLLEKNRDLPLNIKFLIEGEEESGSHTLASILEEKKEKLKADHILMVDSEIKGLDQPAVTLGARGLVCMTVTVREAAFDLHSGSYGGSVYNPNRALVEMLASTHDKDNRVTIPHFYDDVLKVSDEEKQLYDLSFDEIAFKHHFGITSKGVEKGFLPGETNALRPTLEINGVAGGYGGAGFKTVIPSQAVAKISCRLVPNQTPEVIGELVKAYLLKIAPEGVQVTVDIHKGGGEGLRTSPTTKIAKIMSQAYTEVFNTQCKNIILGGTLPIAVKLKKTAGADLLLMGVSLPTDRIHSPNEHFDMERMELGFLTLIRGMELLGKRAKSTPFHNQIVS